MTPEESLAHTLPDVFGHTLFCDDIRFETNNKLTAVGIYAGGLNVNQDFPVTLKSFALLIQYAERIGARDKQVTVEVWFPGDEAPAIQIEQDGEHFRSKDKLRRDDPDIPDSSFHALIMPVVMGPIVLKKRGVIKVLAKIGEAEVVRLGLLTVDRALAVPPPA